jgi:hypothetical protein
MTMTSPACLCCDPVVIFPCGTRWSHGDHREGRYRGGSVHGEDAQRVLCVLFQLQFYGGSFIIVYKASCILGSCPTSDGFGACHAALRRTPEGGKGGTGANLSTGALHTHDDDLTPK